MGETKSSDRATPYFSKFNILKLSDLLMFEMATFTYKSKNNLLPLLFQNYFSNMCNIHKQLTRGSTNYNFFLPFCRTTVESYKGPSNIRIQKFGIHYH